MSSRATPASALSIGAAAATRRLCRRCPPAPVLPPLPPEKQNGQRARGKAVEIAVGLLVRLSRILFDQLIADLWNLARSMRNVRVSRSSQEFFWMTEVIPTPVVTVGTGALVIGELLNATIKATEPYVSSQFMCRKTPADPRSLCNDGWRPQGGFCV